MSDKLWPRVAAKLSEHDYMHGIQRTVERVRANAEVFTPSELVVEIVSYLDIDLFAPGKTVLDPAVGDGQFLVAAKWIKVFHHQMSEKEALADIYGVDIMRDNVDLCKRRLGGGTILMGNTLEPRQRIEGQTEQEHLLMVSLFEEIRTPRSRKEKVTKANSVSVTRQSSPQQPALF